MLPALSSLVILLGVLSISTSRAYANSLRYVSDVLYIPLKTEPEGQVIKHLKSGSILTVIQESSDGKFVKVALQDQKQTSGWVKERYLVDKPIAKAELATLKKTLARANSKAKPLLAKLNTLESQMQTLAAEKKSLQQIEKSLRQEIEQIKAAAGKGLELFEENKALKLELATLNDKLDSTAERNETLSENHRNEGIKLGLFAVAAGGLAGFLLPYVKPRGRKGRSVRLR